MKRGKDDEKMVGPMFPRLHVNDTEKGGPRAPPRNKMALYEQLSIPSQRFNPPNPSNPAGLAPPASSSQGSGHEKWGMPYLLHQPCSTQPSEKSHGGHSDFNTPLVHLEHKKRLDEEDFTVPTFVQSETNHDWSKKAYGMDEEISPSSPAYLNKSMNIPNTSDKEPKRTGFRGFNLRQEGRSQTENLKGYMALGEQSVKYVNSPKAIEKTDGPLKQTDVSVDQEHRHRLADNDNFDRLQCTGASLHTESRARSHLNNSRGGNGLSNEPVRDVENAHFSILRRDSCSEKEEGPKNTTNQSGYHDYKTLGPLQTGIAERSDDASETSMVDSISALDISPDDVVGIIGQKHFWKARRAIVNQQRVFAVQVFELHRLIKVQRSIAGSPNLLLEDSAYLGKPLKGSTAKKLPLEYIVKPSPPIVKHKDDSENQNQKMECSAENVIGKTFLSSVQNGNQSSNYGPFSGNPLSSPIIPDTKFTPCFHQSLGHQWLIPVMSPSEGLVYKPYPGNGFMGPVCGGCGPPGQNPMMGSFTTPQYGAPTSHEQYPGFGHGYFPPCGMPVISGIGVEQANSFSRQNSGGVSFNVQNQSSGNVLTKKHREVQRVVKVLATKETELQGSTATSPPGERAQRAGDLGVGHTTNGRNALPFFPTSPAINVSEVASQLDDTEQPTRVIKVVPHNARSATESAARIFRSIQQERKQHDSV